MKPLASRLAASWLLLALGHPAIALDNGAGGSSGGVARPVVSFPDKETRTEDIRREIDTAINELNNRHRCIVTLAEIAFQNTQVSTWALFEKWANFIK